MERPNEIKVHVSGDRKLGYKNEFRQLLREHAGIIKTAIALSQRAEEQYDPPDTLWGGVLCHWNKEKTEWEQVSYFGRVYPEPKPFSFQRGIILKPGQPQSDSATGLEVTALGISRRDFTPLTLRRVIRVDRASYFKMSKGSKAFFVKKSTATINPGFEEFSNAELMRNALNDLGDVKVVDAQLGYQDSYHSWYVSDWEDLQGFVATNVFGGLNPINEYGEIVPDRKFMSPEEYREVIKVKERIRVKAKAAGIEILDLNANLFYNPRTKKYVLLDITAVEGDRLNQNMNNADQ